MRGAARGPSRSTAARGPRSKSSDASFGQLREGRHLLAGLEIASELAQVGHERVCDRLRTPPRDGPPVHVAGDAEHEGQSRGEGMLEGDARVRGQAREQRVTATTPEPLSDPGRRLRAGEREARHREGMARRDGRCQQTLGEVAPSCDDRFDEVAPCVAISVEGSAGVVERSREEGCTAVVQRVGEVDLRVDPLEAVVGEGQRAQEGRRRGERMHRRAHVVGHPGDCQFSGAGAAARVIGGLDHEHRAPGVGDRDRSGEPVRTGADDDRVVAHPASSSSAVAPS